MSAADLPNFWLHSADSDDEGVATAAALAVLRGRVYIGLDSRAAAARCFKARHSTRQHVCKGSSLLSVFFLCCRLRSRLTRYATRRSTRLLVVTC